MKQLLLLFVIFTFTFSTAHAQASGNAVPWDATYQLKSGVPQSIKADKGKSVVITFFRFHVDKGGGRIPEVIFKKKDAKTGQKVEFALVMNTTSEMHYVLKEADEWEMTANTDELVYLSGYKYDVQ